MSTRVTYLSGDDCTLNNCSTVRDIKIRLCDVQSWLPQEIHVFDGGTELRDVAPAMDVWALWCEEDRKRSATWSRALELFAESREQSNASKCAMEMLRSHYDFARMNFNYGDLHLVNAYIAAGMSAREFGRKLIWSARDGKLDVVLALLEAKADANVFDAERKTALSMSARYGAVDVVQALLGARADPNFADKYGRTPLFVSCEYNKNDVLHILLQSKADPNIAAKTGRTPLFVSLKGGNHDAVRALTDSNCDQT